MCIELDETDGGLPFDNGLCGPALISAWELMKDTRDLDPTRLVSHRDLPNQRIEVQTGVGLFDLLKNSFDVEVLWFGVKDVPHQPRPCLVGKSRDSLLN